ncbi:hypothetical protein PoB_004100200 [Plakobranchus ocellatus]|uniref:ZP domain-containing protein n=1 Tax=Plakobranchus ocellatus TaxID=259542 RepID=A0AAV4B4R3_9GAST|nr:hypothetical protein PoB_004100200 [Plakobranchus ocellatus]
MDRGAYRTIVEMAMKPRAEGEDGDQIKKAIQELVIVHYNLVMGRHYTIGSTTGVLSGGLGKRRKRFATFGSSWTSNSFDSGWDSSRGYGGYGGGGGGYGSNSRGYGSGSDGYSSRNTGFGGGKKDYDSGSKGYGSNTGYGSGGSRGSSGYGSNTGYRSGGNTGYGSGGGSPKNSHRGKSWESEPWRDENSYSRGRSSSDHRDDGYGTSNKVFGRHDSGYSDRGSSRGGYGSNKDHDHHYHDDYYDGRVYYPKPKKVDPPKSKADTKIINCPVQTNQSSVYRLNATGDSYPAIEIGAELFARSQPGSDLFFFCLFPRAITPGQAPVLEVDQNFVTANMTCPSQDLTLFNYRYQNTAFGGYCWIVQGFQEVVTFSICLTKDCVNCKFKDLKKEESKPHSHYHDDYGHHHHHDGYGKKSNNVTVSRCFTEYRVVQPVHNMVTSGFQAFRQARAPVVGFEPATEGSLQISERALRREQSGLVEKNQYKFCFYSYI